MKQLDIPEGSVPLNSKLYINRPPIEEDCFETILQPNALIRIKAPRQMGKTSLLTRIIQQGKKQGYQTVYLNLQEVDRLFLEDINLFLKWFCGCITDELGLEDQIDKHWNLTRGSKTCCTNYFDRYLLKQLETPLILALDEVDQIFQHPELAVDFFGLLRSWHEKGKNAPKWENLRLLIVHSKEVYLPLNINQSPFNVGLPIELPELTQEQVIELINRHELIFSDEEIKEFMNMLGGHPYLVRIALYHLAKAEINLTEFWQIAPTEEGFYYDHLRRHLTNLQSDPELLEVAKSVMRADNSRQIDSQSAFKLRSIGLIKFKGNEVMPLCNLYRYYFREVLEVNNVSNLHENETTLAAIMFTDTVNSTQLMTTNETLMKELLKRDFQLMNNICEHHGGKVFKNLGDGLLMYFDSAVKAVLCAKQIQQSIATEAEALPSGRVLKHRIGIHIGDVFMTGKDVLGAGVNIASRLQSHAPEGGICISQMVYDAVKSRLELPVIEIGLTELKGVSYQVFLYQIVV